MVHKNKSISDVATQNRALKGRKEVVVAAPSKRARAWRRRHKAGFHPRARILRCFFPAVAHDFAKSHVGRTRDSTRDPET